MDTSSQRSITVYCAENWKMLLARIHHFFFLRSLCVRVLSHVYFTQRIQFNVTVETFNQINVVQICCV